MGNVRKHLFWPTQSQNPNCIICSTQSIDTWTHVLLHYTQPHIHALQTQRHSKVVWEIRQLLLFHPSTRNYIQTNVGTFNNNPFVNTIPKWLISCICFTPRCHYNTPFKPYILYVKGLPYQALHPTEPNPRYTI